VRLVQAREIRSDQLSVGAVNWDGAFVMVAYLSTLPPNCFRSQTILELGAGPGMPGLYAAKRGARSSVTDLQKLVPLITRNIEANGLEETRSLGGFYASPAAAQRLCGTRASKAAELWSHASEAPQGKRCTASPVHEAGVEDSEGDGEVCGTAVAAALQWGAPGDLEAAAALSDPAPDLLLACDTCYLDPVRSPPVLAALPTSTPAAISCLPA
jgi:predicted nicotinamide N-methyase